MKKTLPLLLAAFLITAFTAQSQNKIYDFPFNGSLDASVGTGTFTGGGNSYIFDHNGNQLSAYNHNTYNTTLTASLADIPTGRSARTIALWFQRQGSGGVDLLSYGLAAPGKAFNIHVATSGALRFAAGGYTFYELPMPVAWSSYHHLVLTYDETTLRVFFNGAFQYSVTIDLNTAYSDFKLGSMIGYYDDLKIYEGALSPEQVSYLYLNGDIDPSSIRPTIAVTTNTTMGMVTGTGVYLAGDTANLAYTPISGATFVNWTENGTEVSTDSIYSFVVSESRHLEANFLAGPILNIPDSNFRAALLGYYNSGLDANYDNEIQVAEALAFNGTLSVSDGNISDLTGIEAFVNITWLSCDNNQLTTLDLSNNTALTYLRCYYNNLTSINLANGNNQNITSIEAQGNSNLTCIQVDDVEYCNANWANNPNSFNFISSPALIFSEEECPSAVLVSSINVQGQGGTSTIYTQGGTLQMEATVLPANATNATYTWNVTNGTGAAIIDANGLLTAFADGTVTVIASANDASGVTGSAVITIFNQTVGINEVNKNALTTIYPNPVSNTLNLDISSVHNAGEVAQIKIVNMLGSIVGTYKLNTGNNQIDVNHLTNGVYYIQLSNGHAIKFIKE